MLGRGFVGSGQGCEGSVAATRGGRLKDPEECHAGSFCSESLINMPKTVGCAAAKQAAKISAGIVDQRNDIQSKNQGGLYTFFVSIDDMEFRTCSFRIAHSGMLQVTVRYASTCMHLTPSPESTPTWCNGPKWLTSSFCHWGPISAKVLSVSPNQYTLGWLTKGLVEAHKNQDTPLYGQQRKLIQPVSR